MRFTSEEAFEASECGEPIMISWAAARHIIVSHHCEPLDYWQELRANEDLRLADVTIDAADVLGWLGY